MDVVTQKLGAEHKEELEEGKVLLFSRNGIFQARFYKGDRSYIYKSLKTKKLEEARKLAIKFFYETEYKKAEGLPLQQKNFAEVMREYIAQRQEQYNQSQLGSVNASHKGQTSIHMLRQIKRVSKFLIAYCGNKPVDKIDNVVLTDYIAWRKNYYHKLPLEQHPRNAKLNPADKTLAWEIGLLKTVLRWADNKGYRGTKQLPTWNYTTAVKIVRPTFNMPEYVALYRRMRAWITEANEAERIYTRELLRDYVLILANSGMRVGEANNLKESDVEAFTDKMGRKNYMFHVKGKTGKRVVIPRTNAFKYVNRVVKRNELRKEELERGEVRLVRTPKRKRTEDKDGWFFSMYDGNKVITLIDQFDTVLDSINMLKNRYGEKYSLYSLRHFYAVMALRKNLSVYLVAANMGTSVEMIQQYYGKQVTPLSVATTLGGGHKH
jgi:integrase